MMSTLVGLVSGAILIWWVMMEIAYKSFRDSGATFWKDTTFFGNCILYVVRFLGVGVVLNLVMVMFLLS